MTYLQLINRVLRGLREKQVVSVTSSTGYTELIGHFVNQAKYDAEDAGPWAALRTTITGSMTASQQTEDLTASTNERSYIYVDPYTGKGQAYITTSGKETMLEVITPAQMRAMWEADASATSAQPVYVAFTKTADGVTAEYWPSPDDTYAYKFIFVVPQADLSAASDELSIPSEPVWREALANAIEERGDEFSGNVERYFKRAQDALHRAVMSDFGADPITFRSM